MSGAEIIIIGNNASQQPRTNCTFPVDVKIGDWIANNSTDAAYAEFLPTGESVVENIVVEKKSQHVFGVAGEVVSVT